MGCDKLTGSLTDHHITLLKGAQRVYIKLWSLAEVIRKISIDYTIKRRRRSQDRHAGEISIHLCCSAGQVL